MMIGKRRKEYGASHWRWKSSHRLLVLVITLTACGSPTPPAPWDTVETTSAESAAQYEEMLSRPDIDTIAERYEEMRAAIRRQVVADLGLSAWINSYKQSSSGCRDYPAVDQKFKESRGLPGWYSEGNLPDEKWPAVVRIVTEIAGRYGFGDLITVVDRPGDHEISLHDQYGGELVFGTKPGQRHVHIEYISHYVP